MIKLELPEEQYGYPEDVARIQQVLFERGYDASKSVCAYLWDQYSDSMAAGWMMLPEKDDEVFDCIQFEIHQLPATKYVP